MSALRTVPTVAGTIVLALAPAALVSAAPAAAETVTTAAVRSAHFSPDTAGVDVYLAPFSGGTTTLFVSNVGYGDISSYQRLDPGVYVVSMRPHDAPADSTPVLTWTLDAKAGAAYTAAAIGKSANLQAVILDDELTPPAAATGRVRIVQAASVAPSVSVVANGGVALADKLAFGSTSGYQTVPAGTWDVRATPDTGGATAVTGSVPVSAGSTSTVVVLDGAGNSLKLTTVTDSAAVAAAPVGSVDAGGGGTAGAVSDAVTATGDAGPALGVVGGVAVLLAAGVCLRNRRRHARA